MNSTISENMVGRIKSVYCKDFVSYGEITYYPKKYLNVLTGPNGTGKSTIVSAIILGLGGEPQLLNRSSSIADYIQSNKVQATIVIQIYGHHKNLDSFRRIINQNGSSKFGVNNQDVPKKTFLAAVSSYNIQVSNLCQFLPQDRVQDFSKMNPQELLVNTMSSVCDNGLTKGFHELKEMRSKQISAHASCGKEKETLQKKQKRLEQLQMFVSDYRDREDVLQKLNVYNAKKLWTEAKSAENNFAQFKTDMKSAKILHQKSEKNYKLLKGECDDILKEKTKLREKCLEYTNLLNQSTNKKNELETQLENLKQGIKERKMDMERKISQSAKNKEDANKMTHLITTKGFELQKFNETKTDTLAELEDWKNSIIATRQKAIDQYNKRKELETMLNEEKIPELTALRHKIERLQNVKTQKRNEMHCKNPNLIKAMDWVTQNRHRYESKIYYPMIFELNMENDVGAKYLENVVKQRDLFAFSCEEKSVMSDLINELCVKQKLSVNIIYCAPVDRCQFKPTVPIEMLRKMGFVAYLVDIISGPPAIINKLCSSYHIHNIPFGGENVGKFTSMIPTSIRIYFGGNKKFTVMRSRYSKNTMLTEVMVRGKNYLISMDSKQLATLQKRSNQVMCEQASIKNNLVAVDREFERLQHLLREEGEAKKKTEQKILHFKNLEIELESLKKKAEELKKLFSENDTLKIEFRKSVITDTRKMLQTETKLIAKLKVMKNLQIEKKKAQTLEAIHKVQHENQGDALKESEDALRKAKDSVDKLTKSIELHKETIAKKHHEVSQLCEGKLPTNKDFPFKLQFTEIENLELEQINEAVYEFEARLEIMKNVNADTINEHEQLQAEVEQLKQQICDSATQGKTLENEINVAFNKWEPNLLNLIESISSKFSAFMESMDYVGEVVLTNSDKFDFGSYGIQIMVQYRKDAQLQMLDKYVQSGGERAVAIAVYSLSLQHIIHVPFRCVDEINQGMDSINERRIFDLLLKEATKKGSAQYLFVTPKLLRDLNYNEHLCISIVHNSKTIHKTDALFPLTN